LASSAFASALARAYEFITTALSRSLTSSCRSMNAFTASSADTFLARIISASLVADM
jgi:hypothetical protein